MHSSLHISLTRTSFKKTNPLKWTELTRKKKEKAATITWIKTYSRHSNYHIFRKEKLQRPTVFNPIFMTLTQWCTLCPFLKKPQFLRSWTHGRCRLHVYTKNQHGDKLNFVTNWNISKLHVGRPSYLKS